jgi:Tol biopolymer transport system component
VGIDILKGETFDSPQNLWGDEDYIWSPDSKSIIYVSKKKGTQYAISTNTDLYEYNLATGITINRTADNLDMT